MDKILIRQLEVFAYHGCNEDEKLNGQKFYVDADLEVDIRTPGVSDNLEETVNYAKACKFINKFMTDNRFDLIEAVAEQTTRALLKEFPKIKSIKFTINKPNAPIKLPFGNVAVTVERCWHKAYLSLGSNIGDKEGYLNQAIDGLYDDDNCRVLAISKFIETAPYGPVEQENFLNGCVEIETLYAPEELLRLCNRIEAEAHRIREVHWGPRTLDIDIILYDNIIVQKEDLKIPHVEMHQRLFVLEPLKEIAPYAIHPVYNKYVSQLLDDLKSGNGGKAGAGCAGCSGCSLKAGKETADTDSK